jgi:hypothetical protein
MSSLIKGGRMNTTERQIVASLDQLHRELVGIEPCRWAYDGKTDTYSCSHLEFTGRTVIYKVEGFNRYTLREE